MSFTTYVKTKNYKNLLTYNMNSFTMDSMIDKDQLRFAQPFTMTLAGVEGNHRFCSSYTSPNSTAHARVSMTMEECYIVVMEGRCVNKTQT